MQQQPQPRRRGSWTWMVFALAAVAVLAYGIVQSRNEENSNPENPPPAATPGAYTFIDIVGAFENADLEVEIIPSTFRSPQFSVPGQALDVDGEPVYLFIYTGQAAVETREAESQNIDPFTLTIRSPSGTPVIEGEPHVVFNSNVIAVVSSDDQDVIDKVDEAIQGLQ